MIWLKIDGFTYVRNADFNGCSDYYTNYELKLLINKTNYLQLLTKFKDEDIAQTNAFNKYIMEHGQDKYTEIIRKTEMMIKLLSYNRDHLLKSFFQNILYRK